MQINIGGLIISVTFLLVYIVAPLGSLLIGLYQLSSKKRVLTDMGKKVSNIILL
ncbi:MAG: hypothetical protein JXR48_07415 [Candidatus Delongbacteria bacterium]|nr:hypothetical protein [Candidatus Delongbacteria bacterium]